MKTERGQLVGYKRMRIRGRRPGIVIPVFAISEKNSQLYYQITSPDDRVEAFLRVSADSLQFVVFAGSSGLQIDAVSLGEEKLYAFEMSSGQFVVAKGAEQFKEILRGSLDGQSFADSPFTALEIAKFDGAKNHEEVFAIRCASVLRSKVPALASAWIQSAKLSDDVRGKVQQSILETGVPAEIDYDDSAEVDATSAPQDIATFPDLLAAWDIRDPAKRARRILDALIGLPEPWNTHAVARVVGAISSITAPFTRCRLLIRLLPFAADGPRKLIADEAYLLLMNSRISGGRIKMATRLASYLDDFRKRTLLDAALAAVKDIVDPVERGKSGRRVLAASDFSERERYFTQLLVSANDYPYPVAQVQMLGPLLTVLDSVQRVLLKQTLVEFVKQEQNASEKARLYAGLAPWITLREREELLPHVIQSLVNSTAARQKVEASIALLPVVSGDLRAIAIAHGVEGLVNSSGPSEFPFQLLTLALASRGEQRADLMSLIFQRLSGLESDGSKLAVLQILREQKFPFSYADPRMHEFVRGITDPLIHAAAIVETSRDHFTAGMAQDLVDALARYAEGAKALPQAVGQIIKDATKQQRKLLMAALEPVTPKTVAVASLFIELREP